MGGSRGSGWVGPRGDPPLVKRWSASKSSMLLMLFWCSLSPPPPFESRDLIVPLLPLSTFIICLQAGNARCLVLYIPGTELKQYVSSKHRTERIVIRPSIFFNGVKLVLFVSWYVSSWREGIFTSDASGAKELHGGALSSHHLVLTTWLVKLF